MNKVVCIVLVNIDRSYDFFRPSLEILYKCIKFTPVQADLMEANQDLMRQLLRPEARVVISAQDQAVLHRAVRVGDGG